MVRDRDIYSNGRDGLQIFDLMVKTNKIQWGIEPIETYYFKLITLWKKSIEGNQTQWKIQMILSFTTG